MKLEHLSFLATHLQKSSDDRLGPLMRVNGMGDDTDPLRIAVVLRHLDMADETTPDQAHSQTAQVLAVLDSSLSLGVQNDLRKEKGNLPGALREVLLTANVAALNTHSYYSAGVAFITHKHIALAGIGDVKAWLYNKEQVRVIMEPAVISPLDESNSAGLLTSALGVGFDATRIQSCQVEVEVDQFVIIGLKAELPQLSEKLYLDHERDHIVPAQLLSLILTKLQVQPPFLAVVGKIE